MKHHQFPLRVVQFPYIGNDGPIAVDSDWLDLSHLVDEEFGGKVGFPHGLIVSIVVFKTRILEHADGHDFGQQLRFDIVDNQKILLVSRKLHEFSGVAMESGHFLQATVGIVALELVLADGLRCLLVGLKEKELCVLVPSIAVHSMGIDSVGDERLAIDDEEIVQPFWIRILLLDGQYPPIGRDVNSFQGGCRLSLG